MTNRIHVGLVLVLGMCNSYAASTPIPQTNYMVQSISSYNANHPVANAFDNDIDIRSMPSKIKHQTSLLV